MPGHNSRPTSPVYMGEVGEESYVGEPCGSAEEQCCLDLAMFAVEQVQLDA